MLGMAVDITDRKQAEQELQASEDRLAGIVGSAMDAIIAVDEERRIVLFNAAAEKMFGCTRREAVGTLIDRFIPERFRSEHGAYMRRFGESGATTRAMGTPGRTMGRPLQRPGISHGSVDYPPRIRGKEVVYSHYSRHHGNGAVPRKRYAKARDVSAWSQTPRP